jgi:hypothetical protein
MYYKIFAMHRYTLVMHESVATRVVLSDVLSSGEPSLVINQQLRAMNAEAAYKAARRSTAAHQ